MDVALLSEVRDGREIVLWAVGNGRLPEFVPGASAPLRDTICQRLLDGTIDSIVHDARRGHARARPAGGPRHRSRRLHRRAAHRAPPRAATSSAASRATRARTCRHRRAVPARSGRERPPGGRPRGRRVLTWRRICVSRIAGRGPGEAGQDHQSGCRPSARARRSGRPGTPVATDMTAKERPMPPADKPTPPDKRERDPPRPVQPRAASLRAGVQYTRPGRVGKAAPKRA